LYSTNGDLTKRYNRLKQAAAIGSTGTSHISTALSVAPSAPTVTTATLTKTDENVKDDAKWHDTVEKALASKYANRIHLGDIADVARVASNGLAQNRHLKISSAAMNDLKSSSRKAEGDRYVFLSP
jgi:hypothetical protein